jgi:K+-transporting ATPase ATPase C chain
MSKIALKLLLWMTLLTGVVYPLMITLIAQVLMPLRADGDLIYRDGEAIGAKLIAQSFNRDDYFWPRPSAVDYKTLPSGASNFGPINKKLLAAVEERRQKLVAGNPSGEEIPPDLLFASASGLDPHISLSAAHYQVARIAAARKWEKEKLLKLIDEITDGKKYVNVLLLNLALDKEKMGESDGR